MKAVVLAGGLGTRLGLADLPKPMVPVHDRPLLDWILQSAKRFGLVEALVLTGHLGHAIQEHLRDERHGLRISYSHEFEARGTVGAVTAVADRLHEPFFILYGDVLIDVDLRKLREHHEAVGADVTILVHPNSHPHDSDVVRVDGEGWVTEVLPKPHADGLRLPNLVNAALYYMEPRVLDDVAGLEGADWGRDALPWLVCAGRRVAAYRSIEYARDVGTPVRLQHALDDITSGRYGAASRGELQAAVFFDRDGVLNTEVGGVHRPELLTLTDHASEAVALVNRAGLPAICVTNQPDIAKGFMTHVDLRDVHEELDTQLAAGGAFLDDVLHCPHHPSVGHPGEVPALKGPCACRKPGVGMLRAAAERHGISLDRSWLIGDRYADLAAAASVGMRSVLVRTGHAGGDWRVHPGVTPTHTAEDVLEAVRHALEER